VTFQFFVTFVDLARFVVFVDLPWIFVDLRGSSWIFVDLRVTEE